MGVIVVDRGPAVGFALAIAMAAIPDIGVTVGVAGGAVRLRGSVIFTNGSAAVSTYNVGLRKNGAVFDLSLRQIEIASTHRVYVSVEAVDEVAVPGDVYTIWVASNPAPGNTSVVSGYSSLEAEARQVVTTLTVSP